MNKLLIFIGLLLNLNLLLGRPMPWATGQSKVENLQFYLTTFGPGDDIPSYWGHVALIVEDTLLHQSAIYNYGLYSFDKDFLLKFVKGRLMFEVGRASVAAYFQYYRSENRDIRLTKLHLPLKNRLQLAKKLEWNVLPENKKYLYHHYYDNCSTRLRDLIDQALDGQFHQQTDAPAKLTLRAHTKRYVARNPILEWLLMFLMSDRIDQPIKKWDEMFLPDELERYLKTITYFDSNGQKFKVADTTIFWFKAKRKPVPQTVPHHEAAVLGIGLLFSLMGLSLIWWQNKKGFRWFTLLFSLYHFLIGLILGILGSALFFLMFFTEHDVTFGNENILLAHPLTLLIALFAVFWAREKSWALKGLKYLWLLQLLGAIILIILKLFFAQFDQDNLLAFCFILPIDLFTLLGFYLLKNGHSN